jgi:preprotein translocase subunit YajC
VEVRDDVLTVELAKDVQVQLSRGSVAAVVQKDAKDQAAKESK